MFWKLLEQTVGAVCTPSANEREPISPTENQMREMFLPHFLWSVLKMLRIPLRICSRKALVWKRQGGERSLHSPIVQEATLGAGECSLWFIVYPAKLVVFSFPAD